MASKCRQSVLGGLFFIFLFAQPARAGVGPVFAATMSLIPGLGQMTNGAVFEGMGWFLASVVPWSSSNSDLSQIGFDIWQYNIYDAYRDAGARPSDSHNVFENYLGAFNLTYVIDPIGAPVVGTGAAFGYHNQYPSARKPLKIAVYGFVGLGEEGLFRGFLFPTLSDLFASKWAGALVSSAAFSAAHAIGGKENLNASPLIQRFILGMLFSWQVDRNNYDLRKSIFAHAWYDILVDSGSEIRGLAIHLPF